MLASRIYVGKIIALRCVLVCMCVHACACVACDHNLCSHRPLQQELSVNFFFLSLCVSSRSLEYNVSGTVFYIGRAKSLSKSDIRPLNISNTFPVPVVIHSIELQPENQPHFTVSRHWLLALRSGRLAKVSTCCFNLNN